VQARGQTISPECVDASYGSDPIRLPTRLKSLLVTLYKSADHAQGQIAMSWRRGVVLNE
jgi:hypothetical protein